MSLELTPQTSQNPIAWDVKPFNVSSNSTHVTNVKFSCTGTWCINEKVYELYFRTSCNTLTRIPQGLQEFFPNLVVLSFNGCFINSLQNDDLKQYPGLNSFYLQSTLVDRIPSNFFQFTPRLTTINLKDNIIRYVEKNAFDNLWKLNSLNFDQNICFKSNSSSYSGNITALIEEIYTKCSDDRSIETTTPSHSCSFEDTHEEKLCKIEKLLKEIALKILEIL